MAIDHRLLAQNYFRHVNDRAARQIGQLFVDDGLIVMPDGTRVHGRQAIHDFYQALFDTGAPAPRLLNTIGAGTKMATEMRVQLADGTLQPAADFFELTESGLIIELRIYAASPASIIDARSERTAK